MWDGHLVVAMHGESGWLVSPWRLLGRVASVCWAAPFLVLWPERAGFSPAAFALWVSPAPGLKHLMQKTPPENKHVVMLFLGPEALSRSPLVLSPGGLPCGVCVPSRP